MTPVYDNLLCWQNTATTWPIVGQEDLPENMKHSGPLSEMGEETHDGLQTSCQLIVSHFSGKYA